MSNLKVILHAPTPQALQRARNNAANLRNAAPDAVVRIVANAQAVEKAVGERDAATDQCLTLCNNSLKKHSLDAPEGVDTTASAILLIAQLQQEGWLYIRA